MAYQSLYRKYRPQTFADVMGQEHVTRTLQNAVAQGRVANGYLFTGTRGTAKTTVARLLAKVVNCLNVQTGVNGLPEPCNACEACQSITAGSATDVIEMDAASHRGVADIEEVRRAVGYGPMSFRYKVFIIDEAHQLSNDAKDAFLKTLEEPPGNVVFILATTEPQAIPITIRSRCQQFDFKRGTLADIADRIRYVLGCENVRFDDSAVYLVARDSEGSWRDALSLLEQVLAYSPEYLSTQSVEQALGVLDYESLARVTRAMRSGDVTEAFAVVAALMDAGKEARTILRTLALHLRDLLLVNVGGGGAMDGMSVEEVARRKEDAQGLSPAVLLAAIEMVNGAQGELRFNNQHRLILELTFLKLMNIGRATPAPPAFVSEAAPKQSVVSSAPSAAAAEKPVAPPPLPPVVVPVVTATAAVPAPVPTETPTVALAVNVSSAEPETDPGQEMESGLNLETVQSLWPTYLQTLEGRSKMAAMTLQGVTPYAVQGNLVTFLFSNPQRHSQVTESRPRQEFLLKALRDTLGVSDVAIRYLLNDGTPPPPPDSPQEDAPPVTRNAVPIPVRPAASVAVAAPPRQNQPAGEDFEMAMEITSDVPPNPESDPLVQDVLRIFGGHVVRS